MRALLGLCSALAGCVQTGLPDERVLPICFAFCRSAVGETFVGAPLARSVTVGGAMEAEAPVRGRR